MSSTTKTIIGIFAIIIALLCVPVVDAGFVARTTKLTAQSNNDGISNPITTTITTITSSLTDKVPSFLEAYWTDNTTTSTTSNNKLKKEVGPGEGVSTLAIVLVNRGRSEITGVTGYLTLPSEGFRSIEGENNAASPYIAVASHDSTPGESFILNFPINILPEAKVGAYSSSLNLVYSKVLEVDQISTSMIVPFRITGKVILDIALLEQNLTAGSANQLPIVLLNKGSANATGAIVTINTISGGTVTTSTTIAATQPNSISSSSLPSTSINNDSACTNSTSTNATDSAKDADSLATVTTTTTPSDSEEQEETSFTTLIDSKMFDVRTVDAGSSVVITPVIYPDYSADGTIQKLDLEISYNDAYGMGTTTDYSIGMIISPNPTESVLGISPGISGMKETVTAISSAENSERNTANNSIMLTAERIEDVGFTITNNGAIPLSDVVLTDSGSDSVKVLGDSRWRFEEMVPGEEYRLPTTVYAAEGVINTPIEFTVDVEYIEGGQSKTDVLSIGAYVGGQIKVRAYDLAINYVGNVPTLGGNLLNEGNTMALFTTIELLNSTVVSNEQSSINSLLTSRPPQQYLGDLSENSPLLFSIPLDIDRDALTGTYPVNLRIIYSDNLRNVHELILNGTVEYEPVLPQSTNNTDGLSLIFMNMSTILVAAGVAVAAAVSSIFLIRRRKKKKALSRQRSIDNQEIEKEIDFLSDGPTSDQKK